MSDRFFLNKGIRNSRVVRPVSARVFVWLAMAAVIGTVICTSFVVSARQHFEAVSAGYQREQLRQQAAVLQETLKRLNLERSEASSPATIERQAQKEGLQRPPLPVNNIRRPASLSRGQQ